MQNPFVYGEVVPAAAFVDRVVELDRLVGDLAAGAEDLPDLAAPLRQVVADPPRAGGDGAARRAHRRGHRQQLQLLRRVSRRLRPGAGRRRNPVGPRADLAARRDPVGARRGPLRARRRRPLGALHRRRSPASGPTATSSRLAQEVFALPARLAADARSGRSSSRSTSSRRSPASTAARSSTRCAPPCSISARSATCSPDPSRA